MAILKALDVPGYVNPTLNGTDLDVAFCAWQTANGRGGELAQTGDAWDAFHGWWLGRDFSYFANLRQLMRAAWNFSHNETESQMTIQSDRDAFETWWIAIVDAQPQSTTSP